MQKVFGQVKHVLEELEVGGSLSLIGTSYKFERVLQQVFGLKLHQKA